MIEWWHKFRTEQREGSLLLIGAGSGPGRAPLALVSRDVGATATVAGDEVHVDEDNGWHFTLIAVSAEIAGELAARLARRELYSIHPDGQVATIVFRHDKWQEPRWIGGDISRAGVDPSDYVRNGNNAYVHKSEVRN